MTIKKSDPIDVKNLVTAVTLDPKQLTSVIRLLVNEIERLRSDNKALIDEVLKGGKREN
jgi:hypothetical protein